MKKILSAVAAFALAAALISCGGNSDEFDGKVDTVLTIGAPSVTAKAYPGVNYVTWSVVPSATSYELYRQADGVDGSQKIAAVTGTNTAYADVASTSNVLADGKTYKYTVVAVPKNNGTTQNSVPDRAVYMKANSGSASVKAYVPAAGTEITAFTDSYTKDFIKNNYKDAATIAKKAKITFANDVIGGGKITATFPATAGYEFGVELRNNTQVDYILASKAPSSTAGVYLENYTANTSATTFGAGKYKAYLTMKAVCTYYPTPVVFDLGDYEVKALETIDATGTPTAEYNADGKKVVLSWTPAVLKATNALAPVANYKVYRTAAASYTEATDKGLELVPVTATITATDKYTNADGNNTDVIVSSTGSASGKDTITKVYTLEDEVPTNTVAYTYFVVNTDGTEFESFTSKAYNTASVVKYSQETTAAPTLGTPIISKDKDNLYNVIKVTAKKANRNQTLALSYIQLDTDVSESNYKKTLDTSKFTTLTLANEDVTAIDSGTDVDYIAYVEKAAIGTYLFKLTATEAGKAAQSKYAIAQVTGATVDATGITITQPTATAISDNKAVVIDSKVGEDTLGLWTYKLVKVETVTPNTNSEYKNYVTVTSTTTDLTLKVEHVAGTDFGDPSKDYNKYGVTSIGADPADATKVITSAYAIVSDIKTDSTTAGKETVRVWSVQKINKNKTTDFAYSDSNANGKVTKNY